jgi:hypothetical protein
LVLLTATLPPAPRTAPLGVEPQIGIGNAEIREPAEPAL